VAAFQGLERTFGTFEYGFNWPVAVSYLGSPLVTATAIVLNRNRPMVWWIVAALILLVATIVLTQTFNVPLNDELTAAGDPDAIDVSQVRADFRQGWWRAWNLARSVTSA
jgi:uncharacterized membrane protein